MELYLKFYGTLHVANNREHQLEDFGGDNNSICLMFTA